MFVDLNISTICLLVGTKKKKACSDMLRFFFISDTSLITINCVVQLLKLHIQKNV